MDEKRAAAMKEAYDRGILPPQVKAAYEEAQRRGLLSQPQQQTPDSGGFFSTFGHGLLSGVMQQATAGAQAEAIEMGQPELRESIPSGAEATKIMQREVTGDLPVMPGRAGKYIHAAGEAIGSPASYVGPGGLALKIGGGALSAMGGEAAVQALEGTSLEKYEGAARLGGSLLTGLATGTASMERQLAKLTDRLPDRQTIKDTASALYTQLRQSKTQLNPEGASTLGNDILQHLDQTGRFRANPDHAPVFAAVDNLMGIGEAAERAEQAVARRGAAAVGALSSDATAAEIAAATRAQQATAGRTTSVGEIDKVRQRLTNMAGESTSPGTRAAAGEALDALDAFLMNVPERFIVSGNPTADAEILRRAQQLWSTHKQMETVEQATTRMQRRTSSTGTGANRINVARQELAKIINSEKKSRGMPQEVRDKIDQIVTGTWLSNKLRNESKWAPTSPVSAGAGGGAAYVAAGPKAGGVVAVGMWVAGLIAKHAGEYLTDRQIGQLLQMMRAGNPLGAPIQREISPLMETARMTPAAQAARVLATGPLGP